MLFILTDIENYKDHPVILFDGVCNFCNSTVNFIIKQDKKKLYRFAALQSETSKEILQKFGLPTTGFQSFVLVDGGKIFQKSTAGLKIWGRLGWRWKWSKVFWLVPQFLRDAVYDVIARNRYKWFGKKDACAIPTNDTKSRFLA